MDLLLRLASVLMLIGIPIYQHAVIKLAGIVQQEHPEWIDKRGSLSFFYTGRPRIADPNVNMAVLGLAFSSRWRQLISPFAATYAWRIRILLPFLLFIFGSTITAGFIFTP